jgi:serine/threonine protein kinase
MNRRFLSNDSLSSKDRLQSIQLEVAILHDLMHYNIIRIHELVQLEMRIVIVMSFASPVTLLEYIQDKRRGAGVWTFPETMSWSIFRQLVSGVMYLHDNRTIHHNLTLDNVLFDSQKERIVIKGFSLAEIVTDGNEDVKCRLAWQPKFINPYYTAPEVLADPANFQSGPSVYDAGKVDTYSCGVILVSPTTNQN